ncbi:hypothetical protein HBI26_233700 [Parastagonospora nodorum]|nr:hypothetical protein HBI72_067960 [Parastagonospora nodorum]KAH5445926.1 hypothetical protein HBI30_189990 [Parastagonospora nodorum]KAH5554419.1 hypothetical protein HBI26_233700 [Parastagonospora nodorum]KAH5784601.1 hypothetical protein HBI97_082750 [Parastagonospora nodorum]KAH5810004.1 hypothetical protein HBI96_096250 [Parastagonospora nodorum]
MLLPTLYYRPRCGLAFRHPQSWRARANLHRHRSSCSFRCCASKYAKVHKRLLLSNRDIDPIPDVQDITNPAEHAQYRRDADAQTQPPRDAQYRRDADAQTQPPRDAQYRRDADAQTQPPRDAQYRRDADAQTQPPRDAQYRRDADAQTQPPRDAQYRRDADAQTQPPRDAHISIYRSRDVVKRGDDFRLERRVICSSFDSYLTVLGLDPPFRFLHHYPFHDMWNKPTCM